MRILLVSNSNKAYPNTNHYRMEALRSLGHEAVFLDVRSYWTPGTLRATFPFLEYLEIYRINAGLRRCCARGHFDCCVVVGGHTIFPETVQNIRGMGIPIFLWTSDIPYPEHIKHILAAIPYYSRVFCAGMEMVELFKAEGRCEPVWLPFACDSSCHYPRKLTLEDDVKYRRDIAFVGGYYANRREVFEVLADQDIGIWGPLWGRLPIDSPIKNKAVNAALSYTEWTKIYSAAKIVLVVHYQDGKVPCYQASPKLFEALACGAFVLCDDQRDARALFKDGEEVVFFKDAGDLKTKVAHYLAHSEERERIASSGRAKVLARHTYRDRMQEILATTLNHG